MTEFVDDRAEYVVVRCVPEGWVDVVELIVAASAKGFAGQSSAYFSGTALLEFAARLAAYPLSSDDPVSVSGGTEARMTGLPEEHVGITVAPVGRFGQVAMVVHLAETWPARSNARSEVRVELLTTYERMRRFSHELGRVIRGDQREARIGGERLA
jgi:hypothetical protein